MKAFYLLSLLLPLSVLSQKKRGDTSFIFLDESLQLTSAKNAAFPGVSIKVDGGWMLYSVYPDTTPVIKAFYKDKGLTIKQGPYTVYYPKNIKASEGFHNNNEMTGTWRFWYANGQLKDSGKVVNNHFHGFWKSWHPNGQVAIKSNYKDELTATEINAVKVLAYATASAPPYAGIRHGSYKSWYSNGKPESLGQFANDRMTGTWQWFHQNGAPATEEVYNNGVITSLQCFDTTGKPTGNMCSINKPALLKDFGNYKAFVYENLVWPEEARRKKIEGTVQVRFTVGADGTLKTVTVNSTQPVLKRAVEDFFAQMKEWEPAISHNRVVEFTDEMTIPFLL